MNIFVTQEEGRSQNLKKNANEDSSKQQNSRSKSTYNGNGVTTRGNYQESHQASVEIPLSMDNVPSSPRNGVSTGSTTTKTFSTLTTTYTRSHSSPTSLHASVPALSKQNSLSDSSCSFRSSTDSLPGPEGSGGKHDGQGSPQSPPAISSPQSIPSSPSGRSDSEPIYAESTKKKRRAQGVQPESPKQFQGSEHELSGENPRATITVMAAHTEENNRTFFLSSPDSAVSTQYHFSPTARKDPSSPAFPWPSPIHNTPPVSTDACLTSTLHPKPQSSPPIPPKRNIRAPKLGTSSLSPSMSSPVPLPELPRLGLSSLSPSISSPVPLPELPMLFLISPRDGHFKIQTENHSAASERWPKPHHHSSTWNCRIEEEVEEEERERKETEKKQLAANPGSGLVNGAAVWKEARDWKAHHIPPRMTEPGTAPPAAPNNGACQGETEGTGAEEGKHNGSMPAKQPLHGSSSELLAGGKGAANNDPNPPPPPPKKLHR